MVTDTPVFGWAFLARPGFQPVGKLLVALAIAAVFALDRLTPLGIAIPFLYILILWTAMPWASASQTFGIAAASSALTVAGLFLSPESELRAGLTNRTIALAALWFMAYSGMAYRKIVDLLCERERELTDFVENAPVGIHWIAPDGTILWANQNEIGMLGYGREEYAGRNIAGFHVDRNAAEDILGKLDANTPLKDCAARLRHKDGSIRHVLVSCHACRKDGRFTHSRCFMQDITDRIRAELAQREREQRAAANARLVEASAGRQTELLEQRVRERTAQLRESEARLNFSLRMSRTGGWELDLVDHTAHRTLEHDRIFGYDALLPHWTYEQFLGHVLPEDRAEVDRRFREATTKQTEWSFECRIRRVDGEVRWIWAAGEHQRDAAGQIRRMAGIVQDITDRKCAEQALRENKCRLRLAFEDRERLSRDLHDNIIQAIYAIGMQLEACQRRPRDDPKDAARQLAHAIRGLNGVIRDVRGYISGPGPQALRRPGLHAELASLVETMGATGTLRFRLKVDSWAVARLAPPQAEHVLHIAREALSNSLRHSHARQAWLLLQGTDTGVLLEISDDGAGFDPVTAKQHAGGLRNMEFRTQQMGGRLEVLSSPGHGATLILHIPNGTQTDGIR